MTTKRIKTLWAFVYVVSYIVMPAFALFVLADITPPAWLIVAVLVHFVSDVVTQRIKDKAE